MIPLVVGEMLIFGWVQSCEFENSEAKNLLERIRDTTQVMRKLWNPHL